MRGSSGLQFSFLGLEVGLKEVRASECNGVGHAYNQLVGSIFGGACCIFLGAMMDDGHG